MRASRTTRLGGCAVVAALAVCGCGSDGGGAASSTSASGITATTKTTKTKTTKTTKAKKTRTHTKLRRFRHVQEGVDYLAKEVSVPVVVPTNLPEGAKVSGANILGATGFLTLAFPHGRFLTIQYGEAGFDGCGPLHPKKVKVGTNPAVIDTREVSTAGGHYTTLVWPATLKDVVGRYGLSGTFTAKAMLSFAESMERARATKPVGPKRNC